MKSPSSFIAITSEGGLLPADFLHELPDPKTSIEGVTPVAYHLAEGERLNEQINRSWNRLKGCWENFKKAIAQKPAGEPTTTDTRERWLFPLFQELGFGRLTAAKPIEVDGRSYPVSHGWNQVPIHLVGSHADLDCRTPGAIGAAKASPHSLVQSALNASEAHLWGIVSNGLNLRLLRDNVALTRLAFVEFDLQAMFDGDLYSEFFVLWLVCHQSRFEGEKPAQYWLERWKKAAEDKTLRALDDLYPGVKKAIAVLGAGLVSNRANGVLLEKLRTGRLTTQEFYKQVLRVIYRMLFLLVAEDRVLLHVPDESEGALKARRRYRDFYSLARLRALTLYRAGTPHPDLWQVFQLVTTKLGSDTGCPELALPPLGSFLWTATRSTPDLLDTLISNRHFLEAVHALTFVQDGNVRRAVDYKNLGSEELGSVYQGLLEMHPRINADVGSFELDIAAGNERKTSGSYYTPDSLVQCLLDSALEPVIAERLAEARTVANKAAHSGKGGRAQAPPSPPSEGGKGRGEVGSSLTYSQLAEKALLSLKVCDKAAGSGHFIIRAGHRIARHLARVRSGEEEPSPAVYRTALRDVIGHCLYGVDINPMAVELCKVTLWLEAIEPGKPLSFLDHHIRCGNSLLGTTPELISAGLPDETFTAIEGDDKEACSSLKKLNKAQREGLRYLFIAEDTAIRERMHQAAAAIDEISDNKPEDIHRKETAFRNAQQNYDFQKAWDLANLWCAAFVIKKQFPSGANASASSEPSTLNDQPSTVQTGLFGGTEEAPKTKGKKPKAPSRTSSETPIGITTQHLRDLVAGGALPDSLMAETKRLADHYQFFHFHLAFPEVFAQGGFDVSLGNPPWVSLSGRFSTDGGDLRSVQFATVRHGCNTYMPNTYEMFVRLCLGTIRQSGALGLLLPDRFAFNVYLQPLRETLLKQATIGRLFFKLPFPGVTVDVMAFSAQLSGPPVDHMILISEWGKNSLPHSQAMMLKHPVHAFEYFTDLVIKDLMNRIDGNPQAQPLGQICESTSGFGGKSQLITMARRSPSQIEVLKGESISRYGLKHSFWFEFVRENITGRTTDRQKLGAIPKLLLRKTGDTLIVTFDDSGRFPEQSLYFLFNFRSAIEPKYLLGLLNSRLLNFYFRRRCLTNPDSIAQVKKTDLDAIPIRIPQHTSERDMAEQRHVITLVEERLRADSISGRSAEREIDLAVYRLYELTADEITRVELETAPNEASLAEAIKIPTPTWMDRALELPSSRRVSLTPDRYRATLVPHLLYQSGGSLPFDRFRKAYWLLTEPKTLERYATGAVGGVAHAWGKTFRDKLEKDRFIEHLKGAVGRQLHFITKNGERYLELRDPKVADDEHIVFDARLALLVADLWPVAEPITPLTPAEEIEIKQLEAVL